MKGHLVLGLAAVALVSTGAVAQERKKKSGKDPNEVICKYETETGSRLVRRKVCQTRAQMDALRASQRDVIERAQVNRQTDF